VPGEGTVEISGGRRLEYAEWGRPDAPPVLYCHGTPGCRRELLLARPALERSGVRARLIAFSRPGYGASTHVPGRGFLDTARDLGEAMDRLGVGAFAVLGASGGSPFALASAHVLADRVSRVAIVAGVAPPDTAGMEDSATIVEETGNAVARSLRYATLALAVRAGLTDRLVHRLVAALGPADQRALAGGEAHASLAAILREALAQLGRASALEAGLFQRPWEFDPAAVTQEIRLWHGADDNRIPARVAAAFARRLGDAPSVVWPQHGHFSWAMDDEVAEVAGFLTDGAG
jgi:pimeloyl-ACP methyl ester carboxylesterase